MRDPKNRRSERELPRFAPLPCAPLPELELEGRGEKKEAFSDRPAGRNFSRGIEKWEKLIG